MRCKACDVILDDAETLKKDARGVHYDLCTDCLAVSISTHWELENMESIEIDGNITQDEVLTLQENYDNIYLSISRDD
jgi:hypothetical protein|tara:strand:+ start:590 stop:823 length:234 start_codon:yes stop_codon:yes gene_type:complete